MKPIAGRKTHSVKAGDTPSKIAGSQLKDEPLAGNLGFNRDRGHENLITRGSCCLCHDTGATRIARISYR